jgi:hypothetical protein
VNLFFHILYAEDGQSFFLWFIGITLDEIYVVSVIPSIKMSAGSKSSTALLETSKARLFDYSNLPTMEELGEALLNAAARGDQKKLKKILQKGWLGLANRVHYIMLYSIVVLVVVIWVL